MKKYSGIEDSFQTIRVATNNSDVRVIVQKFMTKEQTYSSLLMAVSENEKKYDELRSINAEKAKRVRELQIANENRRTISKPDTDDEQINEAYQNKMHALRQTVDDMEAKESQYAILQEEEVQLTTEFESLQTRKKNMRLVTDQVGGWTQRVREKMEEQLQGVSLQTDGKSLIQVFREIKAMTNGQLTEIKQKIAEQDDEDSVGDKDYIGQFASDDYITKNIRVIGGPNNDDRSEQASKYYASAMGGGGDEEFEESKHNTEAYHQMLDQRSTIKEAKAQHERIL